MATAQHAARLPKTGLLAWYKADTLTGADASAVAAWLDQSDNGYHAVQTDPAQQPALCHDPAGFRAAWFNGAQSLNLPGALSTNKGSVSAFAMFSAEGGAPQGLMGFGALQMNLQFANPGLDLNMYYQQGTYEPPIHAIPRGWAGFTSGGSGLTFWAHETSQTLPAIQPAAMSGGTVGTANGYFPVSAALNEVVIYDHALTAAELAGLTSYFRARYRIPISYSVRLVYDGDSITAGYQSTGGFSYPNQANLLLPQCDGYNFGIPSETLAQMLASAPEFLDPLHDSTKTQNIAVICGGTNDLYAGATPASVYANLEAYCAARRTAGWQVVVGTILPRSASDPFESNRQTLNGSIRANWGTFADGLADIAADSRIGAPGANANPAYFVDGTHPNNTGYGILAGIVAGAVRLLAG